MGSIVIGGALPGSALSVAVRPETVLALGEALGRLPDEAVLFAVEVADTGFGVGPSPQVAEAIPRVVGAVMAEISRGPFV